MDMLKKYGWLIGVCIGIGTGLQAAPLPQVLEQKITQAPGADTSHFNQMRFFPLSNQVRSEPGFLEQLFSSQTEKEHVYAFALYLFNMHVYTRFHPQPLHALDLNQLGVLDGFMWCRKPFDFAKADAFYRAHTEDIHKQLDSFIAAGSTPQRHIAQQEYNRWIELLVQQPRHQTQAAYLINTPAWATSVPAPSTLLRNLDLAVQQAVYLAQKQVVLYDEADLSLENFDHKIGNTRAHRKYTYRWVIDECNYTSYLIARLIAQQGTAQPEQGRNVRLYMLTAYPKTGEFLTPKQGQRFTLANGQKGLHWRYHTAVLVVWKQNGVYVSQVLDTFLAGSHPVPLASWLKHFSDNTILTATPFRRHHITEEALRVPDKIENKTIWVDGKAYQPANVLN